MKEPSIDYLLTISERLEKYMLDQNIQMVHGKGCRKPAIQKLYEELKENALKMWEYAIHMDMLQNRNSCSKTDPDATFMHMKYDYYNYTNVFKPGYNIQYNIQFGDKLEEYHQEARSNMTSDEGIKLMKKRNNESEGTFGDLKYNQKYDRLRRRGEAGVKLEIYLIAIGENLRKYHRKKMKEKKEKQIN